VSRTDAIIAYVEQHRALIEATASGTLQVDWSEAERSVKARLTRHDRLAPGVDARRRTA
jgi:hypothetical protein